MKQATRKERAFAELLAANPKLSATQAALATYGKPDKPTTVRTAEQIASENMRKPRVLAILNDAAEQAENMVKETMIYAHEFGQRGGHVGAAYAGIGLSAANSLLDRVHGKATQRIEQHNTNVNIGIDLTGEALHDDTIDGEPSD